MPAAAPPSWDRIAQDFAVNQEYIWLNSCGIAPMPGPVHQDVKAHLEAYGRKVIFGAPSDTELLGGIQSKLAPIIGANPADVAPIHHTTEGMTFVSLGLDLQAGDRLVLMNNEYPSNVYPWQHWRRKGVDLVTIADGPTPDDVLRSAQERLTAEARVLSVSAVHWCTGMPLPLEALGALCAERDVLFVVDGAQGVGHVPIDVQAQNIGVMAFSAWKWLLGPLGLAGFYANPRTIERLQFPFKGTGSVRNDHQYFPYRDDLKPGAERYVVSTQSFTDWVHFDASLRYLEALGHGRVQARLFELAQHLADALRALGFQCASDGALTRSAIVVARHERLEASALVEALAQRGVVAAERMGWLRMAPHIHLTEARLDEAARILADVLR